MRPKRVASTRSRGVGVPPRWTWPRTVTRVSKPVRSSISRAELLADAAEADVAELVGGRASWRPPPLARLVRELVALADDDDREVFPRACRRSISSQRLLDRDRLLGDQDHVGAAGDPAHDRDPAGVAAHHLDDHHAVVRLRGRVQPVDRLGRDRDGGVEAERVVGGREVVVDRLRDADDRELVLRVEPRRDAERVLAADRDERVEPLPSKCLEHRSTPPSILYGFVRVVPMIVPPRGRIPEISRGPSGSTRSVDEPAPARRARRRPRRPRSSERRVTARMTAFRPGQSPPPVRIPIRRATRETVTPASPSGCRRWESNPHSPEGTGF